jgi:3-oxoadipate enol-lactonase
MDKQTIKLYYEEIGCGIPLILLHGFPLDHSIWYPVVEQLKDRARLILPDLRGHGKSPAVGDSFSMRMMADDVARLMDDLKINKAILVGHSMGGYISFAFAAAFPGRLSGLGLVATQSVGDTLERRQTRYKTIEDVRKHGLAPFAKEMTQKLTNHPDLSSQVERMILASSPQGVIGALKGIAERADSTEILSAISVPSVVISGKEDVIIPLQRAEMMAQMLGHAWLIEIPHAGHLPMLEAPQETADALHQLIDLIKENP